MLKLLINLSKMLYSSSLSKSLLKKGLLQLFFKKSFSSLLS
ncbi:hypothetical protein CTL2C_267 [Chlamydia trachomatis L2c]|nr:hypothetical protein CTL2C_267 [Chlamydia trachomatis L2c]